MFFWPLFPMGFCNVLRIFQIFVGLPLETEQGHFRVLLVFICGVICGAIGSMLINPKQTIYGSSAAVYSLLFSHFSHCILVNNDPAEEFQKFPFKFYCLYSNFVLIFFFYFSLAELVKCFGACVSNNGCAHVVWMWRAICIRQAYELATIHIKSQLCRSF